MSKPPEPSTSASAQPRSQQRSPVRKTTRGRGRRPSLPWRALALCGIALAAAAGFGARYVGVLAAVVPGAAVRNGGMEPPYVDGIALPWLNNSWGDASVSFSRDEGHTGSAAQHLHCESVTEGAAQIRQVGIAVHAGQVYTLTVWLRGSVNAPVFVGVRENAAPYRRYLAQSVRVSREWRRYEIIGAPREEGSDAGIYIAFTVPGDLWIDDVELREGGTLADPAHLASALPERKGNLLYNSGFELGPDGWGPVGRLRIETGGARQGQACARCTPGGEPILLESRPVVIRPGQRYTISANLRASGPAEIEMVVMEYADAGGDDPSSRDALRQTFRIGRQWQRVSLSGVLRAPLVNGYVLQLNLISGASTVWADALQWEEGGLTAYQPGAPVEAAVRAQVQLLAPGQPAVTECRVTLLPKVRTSVPVTFRLEDAAGRPVTERTVRYQRPSIRFAGTRASSPAAQISRANLQTVRLSWKLPQPGIYRVVAVPPHTSIGRTGQAIVCCLPGPPPRATSRRIGIHAWSDPNSPDAAIKAAAYLGAGAFRLHDFRSFVQWYEAEPNPGQFVWFDRDVEDLTQRNFRLLGTLCRTPLWAGQEGSRHHRYATWCSAPPRDWEAWTRYVEAVVHHYHHQIHEWEVWNEPWDVEFWTGTPAEYVQLLEHSRRAIKAADPDAVVVGGCFNTQIAGFTAAVLQAGGLASMDVVSYHDYMTPAMVEEPAGGGAPTIYQVARNLRAEIQRRGGRQPLWCTETGVPCPSFYSWLPEQGPLFSHRAAVATLVKGLTLMFAAGVDRAYYYNVGGLYGGPGYLSRLLNSSYTLLDYDGSPKPTLPALAQVVAMLGDAGEPSDISTPTVRAYAFRRASGYVAVAWARRGSAPAPSTLTLTGPGAPAARDAMGAALSSPVTIGDQPIYLLAHSREALARAVAADSPSE
jgi:hypothetical protein